MKYLYLLNYPEYEEELINLELKYLFEEPIDITNKCFISDRYYNLSISPYLKEGIDIIYESINLQDIIDKIVNDKVNSKKFKILYLRTYDKTIPYNERLESLKKVGEVIIGEVDIHDPKEVFALTYINGMWYFGIYLKNDFEWHIHERKPNSYSNSIGVRTARTLVNIALGSNRNLKLVDPCCGVGTVVIEALSMGLCVKGYDINISVASKARRNLEFFGYDKDIITRCDIKDIKETYDTQIIDLPYNLFTPITREEQIDIINSAYNVAPKLVLLTFEDMEEYIISAGFDIVDRCSICKGKFVRRLIVCSRR